MWYLSYMNNDTPPAYKQFHYLRVVFVLTLGRYIAN